MGERINWYISYFLCIVFAHERMLHAKDACIYAESADQTAPSVFILKTAQERQKRCPPGWQRDVQNEVSVTSQREDVT